MPSSKLGSPAGLLPPYHPVGDGLPVPATLGSHLAYVRGSANETGKGYITLAQALRAVSDILLRRVKNVSLAKRSMCGAESIGRFVHRGVVRVYVAYFISECRPLAPILPHPGPAHDWTVSTEMHHVLTVQRSVNQPMTTQPTFSDHRPLPPTSPPDPHPESTLYCMLSPEARLSPARETSSPPPPASSPPPSPSQSPPARRSGSLPPR